MRLWDTTSLESPVADPVKYACAITGGGLDRTEWARYLLALEYVEVC